MPDEEVRIVCTGRGQHGSRDLGGLRMGAHGVEEVRWRRAVAPWGKGAVVSEPGEDATYPLDVRVPVAAESVRADYEGRIRYRFNCPSCPVDVPWRQATAEKVIAAYLAAGRRAVDVSWM